MTRAITVQLEGKTSAELDQRAARLDRPRDELVDEAVDESLAFQQRQIEKIKEGIAELDRGEGFSQEEMELLARKDKATA